MKIHQLLSGPEKWTRYVPARDANGNRVQPRDESAVRWDLLGAIARCYPPAVAHEVEMRLRHYLFARRNGKLKLGDCLSCWNDSTRRTFEEVQQLVSELDV